MSPLARQWTLLLTLARRRGMTVAEMAREHDVVERTIRRDLDLMRSVGLPLVESVGDYGRKTWGLDTAQLAQLLAITPAPRMRSRSPDESVPSVLTHLAGSDGSTCGG